MKQTLVNPLNFPIQYKELNHFDFLDYNFEDADKTIIEPNDQGFISESLLQTIDLTKKDTTVINAAVGQGKTTAIIDFIAWYYRQNQISADAYKVVVVTPFKALNDSYQLKIESKIKEEDICFNYQELERLGVNEKDFHDFYLKPIQLISIKSILGDSGNAPIQSKSKRDYYEYLTNRCKESGERVIMIVDEIHESLDTFKPKLLANLFRWEEVIHKIIVASATFSESSKSALKFLAELTDKNMKIIESTRTQHEDNLSELNLCFYNQFRFKVDDQYILNLVEEQLEESPTINILCYSKKLANEIYSSSIGSMLKGHYGNVNLCTGDSNEFFDDDCCNIGTQFKTGISIEKENSSYFVILPLKFAYQDNNSSDKFGIFTDRINSLIQSLARPRKKSKVFIVMPSPENIILTPMAHENYIEQLSLGYLELNVSNFKSFDEQDMVLRALYIERKENREEEIKRIESLSSEIKTQFPPYDWFKISEGDRILYLLYDSYGRNLTTYTYWAAWNNQFVNCRLNSIIEPSTYFFEENNVQHRLEQYFGSLFDDDSRYILASDKECYQRIRNTLYANKLLYKGRKDKDYKVLEPNRNLNFEQQLITFIQNRKIPQGLEIKGDSVPEKEAYFRMSIAHSNELEKYSDGFNDNELMLVNAYNAIQKFKRVLLDDYSIEDREGEKFLPKDSMVKLGKQHSMELKATFKSLNRLDPVLKSFNMLGLDKEDKTIYSFLRRLFFITSPTTKMINGKKISCLKIDEEILFPDPSERINLVYTTGDKWLTELGHDFSESEILNIDDVL